MGLTQLPGLEPTVVDPDSPLHVGQRYLASAYDSVASLVQDTYQALRAQRGGSRGRLTHAEQDVFRAATVFAGAGVDAVLKEALRKAIPIQIRRSEPAKEKYVDFVVKHLQSAEGVDPRRLARLLISEAPGEELRENYILWLTGSSLQSRTQVTNTLAALGLQSQKDLFKDASGLDPLFKARNEIAHEMDMTPSSVRGRGKRSRRERALTTYIEICHVGLNYTQRVLNGLESELNRA
jgi:hypothetical protein